MSANELMQAAARIREANRCAETDGVECDCELAEAFAEAFELAAERGDVDGFLLKTARQINGAEVLDS